MTEFIGVIIIALAFALLGILTPWFRRYQDSWYVRMFLGDIFAIGFIALIGIGGSLVVTQLDKMRAAGESGNLAIAIVALLVGVPLITYAIRRVVRAVQPTT